MEPSGQGRRGEGRVQGGRGSALAPGSRPGRLCGPGNQDQVGDRWGELSACLPVAPAWAGAPVCQPDDQVDRWTEGKGLPWSAPSVRAWGQKFPYCLCPARLASPSQYLCKCSQLGKMRPARRPGGGTELASGGCSLVASLRERRGWAPGGSAGGFNRLGGLQCGPCCRPQSSLCPRPLHTQAPHAAMPPFLTKTPPGTGAI